MRSSAGPSRVWRWCWGLAFPCCLLVAGAVFGQDFLEESIGAHQPEAFTLPSAVAGEDEVASVGAVAGLEVVALVLSEALDVALHVDGEDVVVVALVAAAEDDAVAAGGPLRGGVVGALEGEAALFATVGVHDVDVSAAGASGDEGDAAAVGAPGRGDVD